MHPTDGAHAHTPYILANKLRYKQKKQNKNINYVISSYPISHLNWVLE